MSWFTPSLGSVTPTPAQFRQVMANTIPGDEAARLYEQHVTPGQPWPLLRSLLCTRRSGDGRRLTSANRGPLLLIGAAQDRLIRESSVSVLHQRYRSRHPVPSPTTRSSWTRRMPSLLTPAGDRWRFTASTGSPGKISEQAEGLTA
jgi:hypothetical protein